MSVVLFSAWRSFPAEVQGLGHWSLGLAGIVVAGSMYAARHVMPDHLGQFCANAMLLCAIGLWMIGTQKFYGVPPGWPWFFLVSGVGTVFFVWTLFIRPNFALRIAGFSFLACSYYAVQFVLIVRRGERHVATYGFAFLMLLQALAVLVRGVMIWKVGAVTGEVTEHGAIPGVYFGIANFMALMLAVGFMAVATRRLQCLLEQRSNQDPLTCVLNRRGFSEIYARTRAKMRRDGRPMALLSIDLDLFKRINDQFGHSMGDRVLMDVAHLTSGALREIDYVARFGGEEFVVLLPETTIERATLVAARIQALVREARQDDLPPYSISIGVASQLSPDDALDGLLARADAALYRAKANGRDRTEVCTVAPPPFTAPVAPAMARW